MHLYTSMGRLSVTWLQCSVQTALLKTNATDQFKGIHMCLEFRPCSGHAEFCRLPRSVPVHIIKKINDWSANHQALK